MALAHASVPYRLAGRSADAVFVTPRDSSDLRRIESEVRAEEAAVGRGTEPLRIFADLVVFIDDEPGAASARKDRLDRLDGRAYRSDAFVFTGTPAELVDQLLEWNSDEIAGFRLRPGVQPYDLEMIVRRVVPLLQDRGVFRRHYDEGTLRSRLGLERPTNRYAVA